MLEAYYSFFTDTILCQQHSHKRKKQKRIFCITFVYIHFSCNVIYNLCIFLPLLFMWHIFYLFVSYLLLFIFIFIRISFHTYLTFTHISITYIYVSIFHILNWCCCALYFIRFHIHELLAQMYTIN